MTIEFRRRIRGRAYRLRLRAQRLQERAASLEKRAAHLSAVAEEDARAEGWR